MTAPTTLSQLHRLLRERMDGFAPGQQRIARLLLADAEGGARFARSVSSPNRRRYTSRRSCALPTRWGLGAIEISSS
jgi:hypothetical protein